jgi:hypothetical protein
MEGSLASMLTLNKSLMGDPCDETLINHSKGLHKRFYTLWDDCCLRPTTSLESIETIPEDVTCNTHNSCNTSLRGLLQTM